MEETWFLHRFFSLPTEFSWLSFPVNLVLVTLNLGLVGADDLKCNIDRLDSEIILDTSQRPLHFFKLFLLPQKSLSWVRFAAQTCTFQSLLLKITSTVLYACELLSQGMAPKEGGRPVYPGKYAGLKRTSSLKTLQMERTLPYGMIILEFRI